MKFVIAGAGTVGYSIAKHLIREGKDVVLVEKNQGRAKFLETDLDCMVVNGEINSVRTLQELGLEDNDCLIAVTDSDEINLIACSIAKSFAEVKKIARVSNLDYSHAEISGIPFLGADYVISPEIEAARQIVEIIRQGAVSDVLTFEGTDIIVRNGIIDKNSIFKNKTLINSRKEIDKEFVIAFIRRGDTAIIPSGNTKIMEGDDVYIVSDVEAMDYIFAKTGKKALKVKKALIIGSTKIAKNLMKSLSSQPMNLKTVVEDYEEAKEISRTFPNILVINSDIRNESLFEEERLNEVDLIVTVTKNQELNMITALYAKNIGVERAVALVSKESYIAIAKKLGIDATVNPKRSAVDAILKYVRKGAIKTLHSLFEGDAEAIEFLVGEECNAAGKMIKNLRMPKDSIIAAITRENRVYIPNGLFKILPKDSVVVIMKNSVTSEVETIFSSAKYELKNNF